MDGGTVPSTTYTQTDIHGTGATANEHVSSVCTALLTESGSGTDISPNKLQPLKHKLGYLGLFIVNSSGHKGGLALLWKEETEEKCYEQGGRDAEFGERASAEKDALVERLNARTCTDKGTQPRGDEEVEKEEMELQENNNWD
nr:uncharacterized protein LOC109167502 [Ipomoea batatas]